MDEQKNFWNQRAYGTLKPLSKVKYPLSAMLEEWFYDGRMIDLGSPCETCELCGKEGLKYQFGITNSFTDEGLYVGSECIKTFNLAGIDEDGHYIDHHQTKRKIQKDRNDLIKEGKQKRVLHCLMVLSKKDSEFDFEKTVARFEEKGKFSPSQLSLILWRLDKNKIKYKTKDFEISLRRARNKKQLQDMEDWKYERIKAALTPAQRKLRD